MGGGSGGVLKIAQLYGYNQTAIDSKKDAKMMFLSDSLIKESKQKVFLKITTNFFKYLTVVFERPSYSYVRDVWYSNLFYFLFFSVQGTSRLIVYIFSALF